jgi:uncharacterized small protein (DUF1192 family)
MVDLDTVIELDERIADLEAELAEARAQLQLANALAAARSQLIDELVKRLPEKQEEVV